MIRIFMIGFSENKGGVESYISNLKQNMDCEKYEVIYSMPRMVIDGKTWLRPKNRHNYIKYWHFWKKFYKENHFDVVYLNTCDVVSIDDLRFSKAGGVPVRIIHSHSSGNQQGIEQKMSIFHQFSEKNSRQVLGQYATHLFACSKVAGDWMFDGRPYQIIKNGISLKKYKYNEEFRKYIRTEYNLGGGTVVGIIGRLAPPKNLLFSVKILQEYLIKESTVKAVFIGDGEQRKEVEAAVVEAGLQDRIIFAGAVDNVNEWMSAIDCLLMPSLFEGLPFVLVEAQAAGLHCVVSSAVSPEANITGLIDYVDLTESTEVWADKLINACRQERIDVSDKLIVAGYSIENTAKEVSTIIESALGD